MEFIIAGIFWLSVFFLFQAYIFYPLSLKILTLLKGRTKNENSDYSPSISILISAFNEQKVIEGRIKNIKNLDYNFNRLELIIGSDCSSDKTNEILIKESRDCDWIKSQIFKTRRGKAAVLNDLVQLAKNEILIFTDANTEFKKDALVQLVKKFSDEKVGGVCGRLVLEEPVDNFDKTNREKLYWIYETQLKKMEGDLGILIAANGGIYAIRKKLFTKFPANIAITDDLYQTLAILNQNFNFIYQYDAVAKEDISREIITEFRRKVRFAATNFQTLKFFHSLLFTKRFLLSYVLWSHKVIRWFLPVFLIILLISNVFLLDENKFYYIVFVFQACFYVSAMIGFVLSKVKINSSLFGLLYYYVLTNLALLIGLIKFLTKKQVYVWDSTPR